MGLKSHSGAILNSNLASSFMGGGQIEMSRVALRIGQIIEVLYSDNPQNYSKTAVEYNVLVNEDDQVKMIYRNCRAIDNFGSENNFNEVLFQPSTYSTKGSPDIKEQYQYQNGAIVIIGFINNSKINAVILAGVQHPALQNQIVTTNVAPFEGTGSSTSRDDLLKELPILYPGSLTPPNQETSGSTSTSTTGTTSSTSGATLPATPSTPAVPAPSLASLIASLNSLNSSMMFSPEAMSLKLPALIAPPTSMESLMTRPDAVGAAKTALQSRVASAQIKTNIINPLPTTTTTTSTSASSSSDTATDNDGQRILGEFNGFRWNINPLGEFTAVFQGLKDDKGNIPNTDIQPTIMKFNKDGEFFIIDNLDQEIKISRKDWQITISDGQKIPNKITIDRLFNRITIESPLDVQVISPNYIGSHDRAMLTGQEVKLGGQDAKQQVILGNDFMILFNALVTAFLGHTHPVTSAPGTTGPTTSTADKMTNSQHLSQNVKVDHVFSGKPDLS